MFVKSRWARRKYSKPQIGRWYRLRVLERKRHCELCKYQNTIEGLEKCHCNCHRLDGVVVK